MTWTYTEEYYKNYTRDTWNESAEAYTIFVPILGQWNPDLFAAAGIRKGQKVLDVATGPGEPALTIANIVDDGGSVLGVDLSERMIKVAERRALETKRKNAAFKVMDAEALDLPEGEFDVAVCRFGLQIVTDPDKAIAEMLRVLRPGGRLAATVWAAPGSLSPALDAIVAPMLSFAEPDETGYLPTPYEMGGDGEMQGILEKAGFQDVTWKHAKYDYTFKDEDEYFHALLDGTPIGHSLREEDEATQQKVMEMARRNLKPFVTAKGVTLPGTAVVIGATKT